MNRQRPLPTTFQAFYHLACLPEWQPIFHEQLDGFCAANLRPACFVLGTDEDRQYVERHLPVIGHENNFGWYETPTLDALWRWSRENPGGAGRRKGMLAASYGPWHHISLASQSCEAGAMRCCGGEFLPLSRTSVL